MLIDADLPLGYTMRMLGLSDIPALIRLQNLVLDYLPVGRKSFITPKSPEKFAERLTVKGRIHGIFAQGDELVAYGGIAFPHPEWPVADMEIHPDYLPCAPVDMAVVQSCVVHPGHRGHHFHKHMIAAKEVLYRGMGRTHCMTEVSAGNPASLKGFISEGFQAMATGTDSQDGSPLLFLHKTYDGAAVPCGDAMVFDVVAQLQEVIDAFAKGYRGVAIVRAENVGGYELTLAR